MVTRHELGDSASSPVILILAHRRLDKLKQVLNAAQVAQNNKESAIILSIDRPTKSILEFVDTISSTNIHKLIHTEVAQSSAQAINRSLFRGLAYAFEALKAKSCVVLEDDIILAASALDFVDAMIEKYSKNSKFRGINLFSINTKIQIHDENAFVMSNFGLGWGWAITSEIFSSLKGFWNGTEDNHWDFIVEPYCRTGFVINPLLSLVLYIGVDNEATHTRGSDALMLANNIKRSFQSRTDTSQEYVFTLRKFNWRDDCYQIHRLSSLPIRILFFINGLLFTIYRSSTGHTAITSILYHRIKRLQKILGKSNLRYFDNM